jgi:hypothetical protein
MKSVVTVLKTIKCEIECQKVLQREKNGWRFKLIDSTAPAKKERYMNNHYSAPLSFFSLSPRKDTISKYGT